MTETAELRIPAPPAATALPAGSVRAIVVDGHAPSRIGLAALLREQAWVGRCLAAASREEALPLLREHRPDLAILDASQTGPFAGAIAAQMHEARPGLQIVLSSRCASSPGAPLAALGAVGFLSPGASGETIVETVRAALLEGSARPGPLPAVELELSDREREILRLLGTGATNREIAARLHLGPDSVKKNATALYRKLGVRNRTEAVQRAVVVLTAR